MTLNPEEAREAMAQEAADHERGPVLMGTEVPSLLLTGLGFAVAYLSVASRLSGHSTWWMWTGLVLALAVLGSALITSRKARHRDPNFARHFTAAMAVDAVLCVVFVMTDAFATRTAGWITIKAFGLLVAPVVEVLSLLVTGRRRRR